MSAKSANIWLSGRHVANMSVTFPAKFSGMRQQNFAGMGLLLVRLKIRMRQQTLSLMFYDGK
jgi:hypothetical protein